MIVILGAAKDLEKSLVILSTAKDLENHLSS